MFESIEALPKATYPLFSIRSSFFKSLWLAHVYLVFLLDLAVEVGIRDIDGLDVFAIKGSLYENNAESGKASGRGEGLIVVDSRHLAEALCDEASLVLVDGAVGFTLDDEYPA